MSGTWATTGAIKKEEVNDLKVDAKTEAEIKGVLQRWADTYRRRDLKGAMALYVPDADVVMVGSGVDEVRVGTDAIRAQYERDWAQTEAASMKYKSTMISKAGSAALVFTEATITTRVEGKDTEFPLRLTGALENRGGKWLFSQLHASMPASGQAEGQSFPVE
jgi:uncharacterized protein (TIGR02246 family)